MNNRLSIQANPQTHHETGEWGFMVTAWSGHIDPPQCVMSEWVSKDEAAALAVRLSEPEAAQHKRPDFNE